MPIYLGSTEISTLYLGAAGYATPNVDAVYIGTTLVWDAVPTITFSTLEDTVCNVGQPSEVGVYAGFLDPGADITYRIEFTVSDGSTATVQWQGSADNQSWSDIAGFTGYVGTTQNGAALHLDYEGLSTDYWVRALVNSTPSESYFHPPCIP